MSFVLSFNKYLLSTCYYYVQALFYALGSRKMSPESPLPLYLLLVTELVYKLTEYLCISLFCIILQSNNQMFSMCPAQCQRQANEALVQEVHRREKKNSSINKGKMLKLASVYLFMGCCVPKKDSRLLTRIHKTQPDCINFKQERRGGKKNKNEE